MLMFKHKFVSALDFITNKTAKKHQRKRDYRATEIILDGFKNIVFVLTQS